jgi:hypothetical protein
MKKLFLTLASITLFGTVFATPFPNQSRSNNSFVFNEQGIEFAVFKDGQFDFNVLRHCQGLNRYSNHKGINISFNTGYDYGAYIQYDTYGAVIQIENTPIYYDYYGRISQAGTVHINYNHRGDVSWIGGMNIRYDSHYTPQVYGYVNRYHRYYTPSNWHAYYRAPQINFCVTFNTPYRRHFKPVRHHYKNPYRHNQRPTVYRNQNVQYRVATTRSNQSDRYKTNRGTRKRTTTTTQSNTRRVASSSPTVKTRTVRSTKRTVPTTRQTTRSTTNRSKPNVKSSSPKTRTKTKTRTRIPNSRVVAQRTR